MKKFFAPTIDIQKLDIKDIIATSGDFQFFEEEVDSSDALGRGDFDFEF